LPPQGYYGLTTVTPYRSSTPKKPAQPGTLKNPLPGGTGVIPGEGQWKYADQGAQTFHNPYAKPTAAAGDGGGGGGGFSDPGYEQFLAQLRAMGALDASERQRAVQTALIRFGLVPGGLKDPYGDVTDLVRGLAGEKTQAGLSTYSRIQDWNKQILSRMKKALAARGGLRSGELGYGLGRQDLGYRQTYDDALSQLLDYISGAQYAFAQSEMARATQQGQYPFDPMGGGGGGGGGAPAPAPAPVAQSGPVALRGAPSAPTLYAQQLLGGFRNQTPSYSGIR